MGAESARQERRAIGALLRRLVVPLIIGAGLALALPATASAGTASAGKLLFYPCVDCHPVSIDEAGKPSRPLPVDFKDHGIKLESHDVLGKGSAACLMCHEPATRNPGMLRTVDGTLIDIKSGDVSKLCQTCHFQKYEEFEAGIHGKHEKSCTAAGCHDPHSPGYFNVGPLAPFLGTGTQVRIFPERVAFKPFPGPPLAAPVSTPAWFGWMAVVLYALAAVIAGGLIVTTIRGRSHR